MPHSPQKNNDPSKAFDAALHRLMLFIEACHITLRFAGSETLNEKQTLICHLAFLGAADCSSQVHNLDELAFGKLCGEMFKQLNVIPPYAEILTRGFLHLPSNHLAKGPLIEGGRVFKKWIQENSEAPILLLGILENYSSNSSFPATPGHLFVQSEKWQ